MTSPPYWGLRDYGHPDQIGLEKTPEAYLKTLLDFFDDVKLKLKDEGNCFVNLGDSYNGTKQGHTGNINSRNNTKSFTKHKSCLPDKCLCMIPQRFAWGMIERGWILRNEIIWAKPNHMPESVTDRLTKAHEVIWHFVKQGKYYYNLDAIKEKCKDSSIRKIQLDIKLASKRGGDLGRKNSNGDDLNKGKYHEHILKSMLLGKNPGDVWNINTSSIETDSYDHFAVFPLELVRKPILAGCPPQGTVLDPFAGSGTVGEFCRHNDRNAILFELNPEYKPLIEERAMLNMSELSEWG